MPSRVRSNPLATLLTVVSAALIVVGRVNRDASWGTGAFAAGIVLLVVAAVLFLVSRR